MKNSDDQLDDIMKKLFSANNLTDAELESFSDRIKNLGNLNIGDILSLPSGVSQTIDTYHGKMTFTLSQSVLVKVTHIDYGAFSIRTVDDNKLSHLYKDEFSLLYKKFDYNCVIKHGDEIVEDWSEFKVGDSH